MELLELIPLEGTEVSGLDSGEIVEVVLRAAVDTTSINGVTTNTEDTPKSGDGDGLVAHAGNEPMLDAVNSILALVVMAVRMTTTGTPIRL